MRCSTPFELSNSANAIKSLLSRIGVRELSMLEKDLDPFAESHPHVLRRLLYDTRPVAARNFSFQTMPKPGRVGVL